MSPGAAPSAASAASCAADSSDPGVQNRAVRLAIVGCGFVTVDRHLPALRHVPEIEVVALADLDPRRAAEVSRRFGLSTRATDVESLLGDPSVDAVAVCTPPASHAELALAALEAGKHVFVEKPIARTLEEADRLVARADDSAVRTMVGFHLRRHRLVERARQVVRDGTLGRIQGVRTAFTSPILEGKLDWQGRRELGGGALLDRAVHHFDLWRFVLGTEVEEIFALTRSERGDDQSALLVARTADGTPVSTVILDDTAVSHDLAVYGTDAALFVDCCRVDGFHVAPRAEPPGSARARARRAREALASPRESLRAARRGGDFRVAYEDGWRDFAAAIRDGRAPSPTLRDGRAALEIALAAAESAASGAPVRVGGVRAAT